MTIYEPKGKAREYSPLALNLLSGCPHGCAYCYAPSILRRSREDFLRVLERHGMIEQLKKDVAKWKGEKRQVLLSFTSDPYPTGYYFDVIHEAVVILRNAGFPVAILSKGFWKIEDDFKFFDFGVKIGASLTFASEEMTRKFEPNAATPERRINALAAWKAFGGRTFASMEPVIDCAESLEVAEWALPVVDEFKIGRANYIKNAPTPEQYNDFISKLVPMLRANGKGIYVKQDLAKIITFPLLPCETDMNYLELK